MKNKGLDKLREGETGKIVRVLATGAMRRRLSDLGFVAGATVECLFESPFGDPAAYFVKGAIIALRAEDARSIIL